MQSPRHTQTHRIKAIKHTNNYYRLSAQRFTQYTLSLLPHRYRVRSFMYSSLNLKHWKTLHNDIFLLCFIRPKYCSICLLFFLFFFSELRPNFIQLQTTDRVGIITSAKNVFVIFTFAKGSNLMCCLFVWLFDSLLNHWKSYYRYLLPPPKRLCFCRFLFVCLCVCIQHNSKSYGRIFLKFWRYVRHGISYKWLNFGGHLARILDSGSLWNFCYYCIKGGISGTAGKVNMVKPPGE